MFTGCVSCVRSPWPLAKTATVNTTLDMHNATSDIVKLYGAFNKISK